MPNSSDWISFSVKMGLSKWVPIIINNINIIMPNSNDWISLFVKMYSKLKVIGHGFN